MAANGTLITSRANDVSPTMARSEGNAAWSIALHVVVLVNLVDVVMLCIWLLHRTITRPISSSSTLRHKPIIYTLCFGGILHAFHIIPIYFAVNPIWQAFQVQNVTMETMTRVCFLQLGLFHLGFSMFHLSLLLEFYWLTGAVLDLRQKGSVIPAAIYVLVVPIFLLVLYLCVWYFFYPQNPRTCLSSRHHDYLVIVENVVILASLYHIIIYNKLHPCIDSTLTCFDLLVSFLGGITLYAIRLSTEALTSTAVYAVLAELQVCVYTVGILLINILSYNELTDRSSIRSSIMQHLMRSFPSFSGLLPASPPEAQSTTPTNPREEEIMKQTMFQRSLRVPRRSSTFAYASAENADALPAVWY